MFVYFFVFNLLSAYLSSNIIYMYILLEKYADNKLDTKNKQLFY